jgi:hypothetical protein
MSHIRKQIRDAVIAKLTGLTTTGANVFQNRVFPVNDSELPGLIVMTDSDTINSRSEGSWAGLVPRNLDRTMHLTIKAIVRGTVIDDPLDQICLEVEKALCADRFLGGLSTDVTMVDTRIEFNGDGEKPGGIATMNWQVEYWVLDTTPDMRG